MGEREDEGGCFFFFLKMFDSGRGEGVELIKAT